MRNPYVLPFVFITSLFFMWGLAISMLDVLNKHFQDILQVSKAQSGLVQLAVYGSYFIIALPAGQFLRRFGYHKGILVGLSLYAIGAFLFYPVAQVAVFGFFIAALFVMGCGLAIIETAANPYVTILGDPDGAAQRLNLAQSFNGLGVILGPLIGGLVLFSESESVSAITLTAIQLPYLAIGGLVTVLFVVFLFINLPEVGGDGVVTSKVEVSYQEVPIRLFKQRHFVYGIIAQFFYIGAQAGIWGFFINYAVEEVSGITSQRAAFYLSGAMMLYTVGRFSGAWLMRYIQPAKLLMVYALVALVAMAIVLLNMGMISVYALMLSCFCMSIMFPTIFSLGIQNLGMETKRAGSFMIMSIVGGAVIPPLMGLVADQYQMSWSFLLPAVCFMIVARYGWIMLKSLVQNV